jgi:imidazolonepropionase
MKQLFTNISSLFHFSGDTIRKGPDMNRVDRVEDAYILVEDGTVVEVGSGAGRFGSNQIKTTSLRGKVVIPALVDSHTHFVFAEPRSGEFADRLHGMTYKEIAERGGGILNSAAKLADLSEDVLYERALQRVQKALSMGTGAFEIKSGYGLTKEAELKMLRVIRRLKNAVDVPVKATFLGAHAVPSSYQGDSTAYVDDVLRDILPDVVEAGLADYIDVFCEKGYFNPQDMERLMRAGAEHGLKSKVHVNQFNAIGGIETAIKNNALSVDHLEVMAPGEIEALVRSETIPVGLPSCSFFLNIPYAPLRTMVDAGLGVALASDYNPGSTPGFNLMFVWALGCIKNRLTPEEALAALTINAACAIEVQHLVGNLDPGKQANFLVLDANELIDIPYSFSENRIESVYINGRLLGDQ